MSFVSPDFDLFKTLSPSVLITALTPDEKRVGGFIWLTGTTQSSFNIIFRAANPSGQGLGVGLKYQGFTTDKVCLCDLKGGGKKMWLYSDGTIKISE